MSITTLSQTIEVTDVQDVVVTDAETDTETGDFVREIRILGADQVPIFTLRIAADDREKINVTAPEQQF
jgi:hypothetical protein